MKISKIKITNLFGIKEQQLDGKSVEISGKNGIGKTSILDAIKYALTNSSDRDLIVKKGENEGEIYIETDTGISIDRKKRTNSSDYKMIKENGEEVNSPEKFLQNIFSEMQLDPIKFSQMTEQEKNRTILDLIEFDWNLETIKNWFGELPDVNYDQNLLQVLNDIQSEKSPYFLKRQDLNREKRNKLAFIEDIAKDIPDKYDAKKWEEFNLVSKLKELSSDKENNNLIEKAKAFKEGFANKKNSIVAEYEIKRAAEEKNIQIEKENLLSENERLKTQIKANEDKIESLKITLEDKLKIAKLESQNKIDKLNEDMKIADNYANKQIIDTSSLQSECDLAEEMKKHINEYNRMMDMKVECDELDKKSQELTNKIELARTLPGEILKNAKIPVEGLTVVDGKPLIDGKPINNLSEGEQLMLCVDVAISKPNSLKLILLDGIEKLSDENKEKIYEKCKKAGLQFIATKTNNSNEMIIREI